MQRNKIKDSKQIADTLSLSDVIIPSTLFNSSSQKQAQNILEAFNARAKETGKTCFTTSIVRGVATTPDEFVLGHRNKIPELAAFNGIQYIARTLNPSLYISTDIIKKSKQADLFFGVYGSYVLNVTVGKFAKAWSGNQPLLFGAGPHVIHDANFKFDPTNEQSLVNESALYIQHSNIHILRVPAGKIAKVWIGTEALLLESQPDPYVFQSALFQLRKYNDNEYFYNATERLIVHGSIKRIMPHTGEVAVTYNNGLLNIIKPQENAKPTIINAATHEVNGFISTGIQTLLFPSEETKKQRRKDNTKATDDEVACEIFTTKDSLKVGVKLLVAYRIVDPLKALSLLIDEKGLLSHIENLATVDMGKAIQQSSSQEFLSFYQNKPNKPEVITNQESLSHPSAAPPIQHIQDLVKDQLSKDLNEFGIELVRLNIETPKIIDPEIAKKMSEQALLTAGTSAQEAVLEANYGIAKRKAEQEAKIKEVAQKQINEALISKAEAELKAAKLNAESMLTTAKAEKEGALEKGKQYGDPNLLELKKLEIQAKAIGEANFLPPQFGSLINNFSTFFGNNNPERRALYSLPNQKENSETKKHTL